MREATSHATPLERVPDLLALHEADPARFPFLLDSAATGGSAQRTLGRYDILFCEPGAALELTVQDVAPGTGPDFFEALDALAPTRHALGDDTDGLPFRGGWFVYASYELAAVVESVLQLPFDHSLPVAMAVRIESAVVVCRRRQRAWLVSEKAPDRDLLNTITQFEAPRVTMPCGDLIGELREEPPQQYLDAVATAKEHIAAGDVFQANLSRLWQAPLRHGVSNLHVYRRLRAANPAPFAGLMAWRGQHVLSSSPERLVRMRAGVIETRPIAGTRPRGTDLASDRARSTELIEPPEGAR